MLVGHLLSLSLPVYVSVNGSCGPEMDRQTLVPYFILTFKLRLVFNGMCNYARLNNKVMDDMVIIRLGNNGRHLEPRNKERPLSHP